ncbi:MAG TPA: serine hydrolase, partial [Candidatus Paceibacterota bacterium]|nr:serine hydrolase [Candidatus Paceibacterota bacterium]
ATILVVGGLILGLALRPAAQDLPFSLLLQTDARYPFLRPLIGVTTTKEYGEKELAPLRDAVGNAARGLPAGAVTRYSYYFRDLTNGMWTGINEMDQYDPASILKIVVAVAVFKQEEATPGFIYRRLTYTQDLADINRGFSFAPPIALTVGQSYDVPYLLEQMLSNSDNGAKDLLLANLDQPVVDHVYTDLAIRKPNDDNSAGYTISPLEFSRFLRILYYGTYNLSWENSNQLLKLLNKATFTSGLVAGVPSSVSVAHKYGEHIIGAGKQVNGVELSDCGIVYHPTRPYLLCIMTEGKDPLVLGNFIALLSRVTYAEVNGGAKPSGG